jgi:hypothetical protein
MTAVGVVPAFIATKYVSRITMKMLVDVLVGMQHNNAGY